MKQNMGRADRIIRALIALMIGVLFFNGIIAGVLGYVLLAIAVIFLLTAFIGSCPLYALFGINTCPVRKVSK
jgi:uncharacterized membrane protein